MKKLDETTPTSLAAVLYVHLDKMPASAVYVLDLKGKVRWGVASFYSIVLEGRKSGQERLSTDSSLSMS